LIDTREYYRAVENISFFRNRCSTICPKILPFIFLKIKIVVGYYRFLEETDVFNNYGPVWNYSSNKRLVKIYIFKLFWYTGIKNKF